MPFELFGSEDELRETEIIVPDEAAMAGLELIDPGIGIEGLTVISNIPDETGEEDELHEVSDVPARVTRLTVEKLMVKLTGESWFRRESDEGYSAGEIIKLLSEKAFVQFSGLTFANVRACLENGGSVIAYFPDLVWREHFGQLTSVPGEVLGMRAVEIERITENDGLIVNDASSADGWGKQLGRSEFEWLSGDGWMLEVYK